MPSRKRDAVDPEHLKFLDGQDIHEGFQQYTVATIKAACKKHTSASGARTRQDMYQLIAQALGLTQAKKNMKQLLSPHERVKGWTPVGLWLSIPTSVPP